jgi:bifunctional oligoribonuclease and PAP phosphatase NrnA
VTSTVKKLAPVILDQIKKSQNILLHCHPHPDGDSVGSSLALMHALASLGKKVTLIKGDSDLPNSLKHLPGFSLIRSQNIFEVDLTEFDLFIILDSSMPSQISRLGPIEFPKFLNTVIIDHHYSNANYAKFNLVDPSYPALGQIIYDLLNIWQIDITPDIAVCLFIAIYTDTGGFRYPNTTQDTFITAGDLAGINPDFPKYISLMESSYTPKTLDYISLGLSHIQTYFSNQVAFSIISYLQLNSLGIQKSHTENVNLSEMLRMVSDWKITASVIEEDPNIVSVSLRTIDGDHFHVGRIAVATGFGGGHSGAAGANLKMSLEEARKLLLKTITKVHPELGSP